MFKTYFLVKIAEFLIETVVPIVLVSICFVILMILFKIRDIKDNKTDNETKDGDRGKE